MFWKVDQDNNAKGIVGKYNLGNYHNFKHVNANVIFYIPMSQFYCSYKVTWIIGSVKAAVHCVYYT